MSNQGQGSLDANFYVSMLEDRRKVATKRELERIVVLHYYAKLAPLSQPMEIQTKTNCDTIARVFPRLAPVTCHCFEF